MTVLSAFLVAASVLFAFSAGLLGLRSIFPRAFSSLREEAAAAGVITAVGLALAYLERTPEYFLAPAALAVALFFFAHIFKNYSPVGILFYLSNMVLGSVGAVWGFAYIASVPVSSVTRFLLFAAFPLLFVTLPFGFLRLIEQFDVLCRREWKRPRVPRKGSPDFLPLVSLHVPVYAEPPEVVIATLDSISRLHYPNFEVIVVDNNTQDERLWQPVARHCAKLGSRFRFFHVDPLAGAKAGALNFALEHTAPEAEVIGIIDSDYITAPHFVSDLIGYFEDARTGFVQTPHDYRAWEESTYLSMCYWEYKTFFHTILVALNERDAALTVGTMCLLRKRAVAEAGGWATWCLTEDSELAIRIHGAGYSSVYVPHSYGRGLIPETFGDFTKQRYRWIGGPAQEFQRHASHLAGLDGRASAMSLVQRMHHFHHGLQHIFFGLSLPLLCISLLLALSLALHREIVPVPFALWSSVTILFLANIFLKWLEYRVILRAGIRETLLGVLAHKALSYVTSRAPLDVMLGREHPWRRTSKFKRPQTLRTALASARDELALGIGLALAAVFIYALLPYPGLLAMCLIGLLYKSGDHLAAPVVAIISMNSSMKAQRATVPLARPAAPHIAVFPRLAAEVNNSFRVHGHSRILNPSRVAHGEAHEG